MAEILESKLSVVALTVLGVLALSPLFMWMLKGEWDTEVTVLMLLVSPVSIVAFLYAVSSKITIHENSIVYENVIFGQKSEIIWKDLKSIRTHEILVGKATSLRSDDVEIRISNIYANSDDLVDKAKSKIVQ